MLAAAAGLSACGGQQQSSATTSQASSSSSASTGSSVGTASSSVSSASSAAVETANAGGRTLVAYYSAQGHTKAVAKAIAEELGADLFVIEPAKPYSEEDLDWTNEESRVCLEHDDPSLVDNALVTNTPTGFADYTTVFVGYPIWWRGPAWAMTAFASENDFTGKTVIPFCTSTSSGIGESGNDLAKLAGTGDWREGKRFSESANPEEVAAWAAGFRS